MSKFLEIQEALQNHPDVIIVGFFVENRVLKINEGFGQIVSFFLAPRGVKRCSISEMKRFISELITANVSFSEVNGVKKEGCECIEIHFKEKIGLRNFYRKITLIDEDLFPSELFVGGKNIFEHTEEIERLIRLIVFNDGLSATASFGLFLSEKALEPLED